MVTVINVQYVEQLFKKLNKIASKEVNWQQRARIKSDVAIANTKLGTSFYVRFTQVGEADIYTWQIEDFKPAVEDDKIDPQLSLFYTEIINIILTINYVKN